MEDFHLSDRPAVSQAIEAAAACNTLEELYAAIKAYKGHEGAVREHFTPGWPVTKPVNHPDGPLMIITEKPEEEDAAKGRPFTGSYGGVMEEVAGWYGLDFDEVHVAYAVHWMPEGEKSLNATQISASRPFLFREIEIVKPRAILVQGRGVLEAMFMYRDPIADILNMTLDWKRGGLRIPCYVTWHPAFALRFKTQMLDFGEQVHGFLEQFGMPDGGPARKRFQKAA